MCDGKVRIGRNGALIRRNRQLQLLLFMVSMRQIVVCCRQRRCECDGASIVFNRRINSSAREVNDAEVVIAFRVFWIRFYPLLCLLQQSVCLAQHFEKFHHCGRLLPFSRFQQCLREVIMRRRVIGLNGDNLFKCLNCERQVSLLGVDLP